MLDDTSLIPLLVCTCLPFGKAIYEDSESMSAGAGPIPKVDHAGGGSGEPITLKHDEISMEPYSGCPFRHQEMVPSNLRFVFVCVLGSTHILWV